jgi:molecular chaperone HscB
VQHASHINEAFRVLKDPLSRARYLLELNGVPFDEHASNMDPAFLMQQMELREALEGVRTQADPFAALMGLRDDAEARERALVEELAACFTQGGKAALERVPELIRKLQFMRKLVEEAEELEEDLVHQM